MITSWEVWGVEKGSVECALLFKLPAREAAEQAAQNLELAGAVQVHIIEVIEVEPL